MDKLTKALAIAMIIGLAASLNLSTSCAPPALASTGLAELAQHRRGLELIPSTAVTEHVADDAVSAPAELTWRTLTDVEFKDVYVDELDAYYWKPTFGESVKALEGTEVYITGYVIPVDYDEDFYVLSRYPFANCFFCGGAGPESVVDLRFKGKTRRYETDERLTFKGVFALNANDVYQMNYILEGAEEYKP